MKLIVPKYEIRNFPQDLPEQLEKFTASPDAHANLHQEVGELYQQIIQWGHTSSSDPVTVKVTVSQQTIAELITAIESLSIPIKVTTVVSMVDAIPRELEFVLPSWWIKELDPRTVSNTFNASTEEGIAYHRQELFLARIADMEDAYLFLIASEDWPKENIKDLRSALPLLKAEMFLDGTAREWKEFFDASSSGDIISFALEELMENLLLQFESAIPELFARLSLEAL